MMSLLADPIEMFQGKILIVAPHMDDEALACGGLIAKLPLKEHIHIIYATDGMRSPSPIFPGRDSISPDLGEVRVQESKSAMGLLGVPEKNLHFLRLPEAQIRKYIPALEKMLWKIIDEIQPHFIFTPFRYDRHPDHLAINQVFSNAKLEGFLTAQIIEYFVYYRSKLLPLRDIRKYIKSNFLIELTIDDVAAEKRKALDCFTSQTTIFYPWQTRPILTSTLLDEECQNPEYFLLYDPSFPGTAVFTNSIPWIRVAHWIEPFLKKWKYLTGAYLKRMVKHAG
jgi:LmbE family N-acetylglucosaminyl deacetylase